MSRERNESTMSDAEIMMRRRRNSVLRRKKRKKNRPKIIALLVLLFIVLAAVGIGTAVYIIKYAPTDEEMNLNEYYEITDENSSVIIVDNAINADAGIIDNGIPYISYELISHELNSRFYWDTSENLLLYTLPDGTIEVGIGESQYQIGQESVDVGYPIVKAEGQAVYIAAEFVQQYTNIEYQMFENPDRLVVKSQWGEQATVVVKTDTEIRYQGGVKSPILTRVSEGTVLPVIEQLDEWIKVCSEDGITGYISVKDAESPSTTEFSRAFEELVYPSISKEYDINMAWHQVTTSEANSTVLETIAETKGLTTIAPTWFFIDDVEGNVLSLASEQYVNYAHQTNIEVWATVNDFDGGIGTQEETLQVLSKTSTREKIINTIIGESLKTGVDGICLDIEHVSEEAGTHYLQFIREMSVKCRQNELVLSVANYPPKSFNAHFNYEEQGKVVDYVIIMGYDEHYGGSLVSGPVASIDYVIEGLETITGMVPAEKVINAVPFYSRVWEETPKTEAEIAEDAGTAEEEYTVNVSSKAYGMDAARAVIEQSGTTTVWDDETKHNYATWESEGVTYKVWLEDNQSLEEKLKVMTEYNVAGSAAWKLGFEDDSTWNVIEKYYN